MNRAFFLRNLWLWKTGGLEMNMKQSESKPNWSKGFELHMRNRMTVGCYRYGNLNDPDKPEYNRIGSIEKRLKQYKKTHNKEYLIDIANLCMCEFEEGSGTMQALEDVNHVEPKRR
jgi:hypothetical protein